MPSQRAGKQPKAEGCCINSAPEPRAALIPDLPLEVIQYMLELCASLKLVKVCRLVSKSWNEISCTVLKKMTAVVIELDTVNNLREFEQFLERKLETFPEFPNPFGNYKVKVWSYFLEDITRFIQDPNTRINVLDIALDPTMSATKFKIILASCKPLLKQLSIKNCCEGSEELLVTPAVTNGWSSLTTLIFDDHANRNVPTAFLKFIQAIIHGNPSLQELRLIARAETVKVCLVTEPTQAMVNLRSLLVDIRDLDRYTTSSIACLQEISTLEAPSLKHITFHDLSNTEDRNELKQALLTIAGRHSQGLESLESNVLSLTDLMRLPDMPQLEKLSCCFDLYENFKNAITDTQFPSLSALQVIPQFKVVLQLGDAQSIQQHFLLKKLDVNYFCRYETLGTTTIWPVLGRHFPCVTNISVSFGSWDCEKYSHGILKVIGRCFPRLESLEFSSDCQMMTLLEIPALETFTERGFALNEITDDPIVGLKNLTCLKLKHLVALDRDFIRFGLVQMEKWRSLWFPWNEEALNSDDIITYLGSLTHITDIRITCESLYTFYELRTLAEETTNVSIIRA